MRLANRWQGSRNHCGNGLWPRFLRAISLIAVLCPVLGGQAAETLNVVSLSPAQGIYRSHFAKFERAVEGSFEGGADVVLLIDGQAGTEESMMSTLRRGRAQLGVLTTAGVSAVIPELILLMAPYLFDSFEEADWVLDNFVYPSAVELMAAKGVHLIQWVDSGWWNVFAQKEIRLPEDSRGVRMRAASSEAAVMFLDAIGADVIPLPFAEVIPGLQTGLVEGGATNTAMYEAVGMYHHAPHLIMTRHALNPGAVMANKRWYDKLSPANQRLMSTAMGTSKLLRADVRLEEQQALDSIRAEGVVPYEPTQSERAEWISASREIHEKLIAELGSSSQEIYDLIQEGKAAYAAQLEHFK